MVDRKPTVWIANQGGHDYDKATTFGNLAPLTKGTVNIFRPDRLSHLIKSRLKEAREDDLILISGPPLVTALAIGIMLNRFSKCNILQYSHKRERYDLKTLWSSQMEVDE